MECTDIKRAEERPRQTTSRPAPAQAGAGSPMIGSPRSDVETA